MRHISKRQIRSPRSVWALWAGLTAAVASSAVAAADEPPPPPVGGSQEPVPLAPAPPSSPAAPSPPTAAPAPSIPAGGPTSTFVLRSGRVVEGTILDRLPGGYLVRLATGTTVIAFTDVASVDPPLTEGSPALAVPNVTAPAVSGAVPLSAPSLEPFGRAGQIVVTQSFGFVEHQSQTTIINVDPTVQVFVSNFVTMGLELSYQRQSTTLKQEGKTTTTSESAYGAALLLGVNAPLGDPVSLWPNVSAGLSHPSSGSNVLLVVGGLSILFHPTRHFFLGLTPELAAERPTSGTGQSFQYTEELATSIGGWW